MKALGKIIHVQQFLKATLLVCPKRVVSSFQKFYCVPTIYQTRDRAVNNKTKSPIIMKLNILISNHHIAEDLRRGTS